MGFQSLTNRPAIKLTELKTGESITGFVVGTPDSSKVEGSRNLAVVLEEAFGEYEAGKEVLIYPAGNVRYLIKDGVIVLGRLTRITRNEDRMVKGKKSSNFNVEQDATKTFSGQIQQAAAAATTTTGALSKADKARANLAAKQKALEEADNA